MSTLIVSGNGVQAFAALTVASALKLYANTGIKANRAYTPKNMMAMATKATGQKFKARAYLEAAEALRAWALAQRSAAGDPAMSFEITTKN